jgi:ELWxxDGT repeat protein
VWRTDGTRVEALFHIDEVRPRLIPLGSLLFVLPRSPSALRVFDTTTGDVRDLALQSFSCCLDAVPLRGRLAVTSNITVDDLSVLFWTDGTQAGTYEAAVLPRVTSPLLSNGRRIFFAAQTEAGSELWTSDGTTSGTRRLELVPGPAGSDPSLLGVVDGVLLFAARTDAAGVELWRSDGSEAGTFLVADVYPGLASSGPAEVVALGDRVHFAATAPDTGRELFHVDRAALDRPCETDATTQCLGQRFEVSADWLAPSSGEHGRANVVPRSDESVDFWFFDEDNLELAVKVLDGRALSGHHWVYYGALSDVAFWVTATDTDTGRTITYRNPSGSQCGHGDVLAFPDAELPATAATGAVVVLPPRESAFDRTEEQVTPGPCGGENAACLVGGRFEVEVTWSDPANPGRGGAGIPLPGTSDTASFWFFDAANEELLVKVLDGRHLNDRLWVYYGALSDVEYAIRVTDTDTGAVRTYRNPAGTLCGAGDVTAFPRE